MSPLPPPSPDGPSAASTAAPWQMAVAVASLICGILSLLLLGAFVSPFLGVNGADVLGIWPYPTSIACGVIGVVLGHLARRIAPGSRAAALATAGLVLSYGGILLFLAVNVLIYLALATGPGMN